MRQDVYEAIAADADLLKFIRLQPIWYRRLMRNPEELEKMKTEAAYFFKKSIPHRVSKFADGVQLAAMMMTMFQSMNSS